MGEVFKSIQQGLSESIEFAKGQSKAATVHQFEAVDVKGIRAKDNNSKSEIAANRNASTFSKP